MEKSRLETTPIPKLMRKYALPCVISLLVAALYNIVDQIFIANASYLGSNGNAANTVVFPLTVIALAVAVMIGDGCCTFVSLCLGRKQPKDASGSIGSAVLCCVSASLVLTACYLLFRDPLLTLFGGTVNEETFRLSKEYFFWITLGVPFYMFGQCLNPIIRSDGSPRFAMISTLAGAAVNLVLDPLFIFGFHWGMTGAAVATVLGQMLTAGLAVWYQAHMRTVKLERESFHFHPRLIRQYVPLGICSFLSQGLAGGGHGGDQQHDPEVRRAGPGLRPAGIRSDSYGRHRHCNEILPDRHFDLHRHGGGLHPDRRVSRGRGSEQPNPSGAPPPSADGSRRGRGGYADCGAIPPSTDRYFRCGQ